MREQVTGWGLIVEGPVVGSILAWGMGWVGRYLMGRGDWRGSDTW